MDDTRFSKLTDRQKACLRLVRAGYTTKEIASSLDASPAAIGKTIKLALAKLGVDRRSVAARMLEAHEVGGGVSQWALPPRDLPDWTRPAENEPSPCREETLEPVSALMVREERSPFQAFATVPAGEVPTRARDEREPAFDVAIAMRTSADWIVKICSALALLCVAAVLLSRLWDWILTKPH